MFFRSIGSLGHPETPEADLRERFKTNPVQGSSCGPSNTLDKKEKR